MRTPHALTTDQRGFEVEEDCSTFEVEVNQFKVITNCIEVATAEVNAPTKVDEEKAPREVGSSLKLIESFPLSGAHNCKSIEIGKKNESETSVVVTKRCNESERFDIGINKRIVKEESGYAVKSVPIEADPRMPHIAAPLSQVGRRDLSVKVL